MEPTIESLSAEVEKLKGDHAAAVEQLNAALGEKSSLSALVAERDAAIAAKEQGLAAAQSSLQLVTGRYRDVVAALPDVAPAAAFVSGTTIEEIDASVEKAKAVVASIKGQVQPPTPAPLPVPNGGVTRQAPDYSGLSPSEKVKAGIAAARQ